MEPELQVFTGREPHALQFLRYCLAIETLDPDREVIDEPSRRLHSQRNQYLPPVPRREILFALSSFMTERPKTRL